jgi:hypothetical protein
MKDAENVHLDELPLRSATVRGEAEKFLLEKVWMKTSE